VRAPRLCRVETPDSGCHRAFSHRCGKWLSLCGAGFSVCPKGADYRHSPCLAALPTSAAGAGSPRPAPATRTARLPPKPDAAGPPQVVRAACTADAVFWPRATCFPQAAARSGLGRAIPASRTQVAVQTALDKTENSITVLGRNVQQTAKTENPAVIRSGLHWE
jgi:hypothetical protein